MKNIMTGRTEPDEFTKVSFSGLTLPVYVTNNTANTAWSGQIIDPTKMRIKATLKGRGADETFIPNLTLQTLLELTTIEKLDFDYWYEYQKDILLAHGSGVKGKAMIPLHIPFGSVINLQGAEVVEMEYTIDDGFFTAQCDQTLSYVQADKIEDIGVETFLPVFNAKVINEDQSEQEVSLGNNVTRVVISNRDKSDRTTANQVITKLDLECDKFKRKDTPMELYGRQLAFYPTVSEAQSRNQNYLIHDGVELDNLSILLTLESTNVNASKNYVLWRSFKTSTALVKRAQQMILKHQAKDLAKVGIQLK